MLLPLCKKKHHLLFAHFKYVMFSVSCIFVLILLSGDLECRERHPTNKNVSLLLLQQQGNDLVLRESRYCQYYQNYCNM